MMPIQLVMEEQAQVHMLRCDDIDTHIWQRLLYISSMSRWTRRLIPDVGLSSTRKRNYLKLLTEYGSSRPLYFGPAGVQRLMLYL